MLPLEAGMSKVNTFRKTIEMALKYVPNCTTKFIRDKTLDTRRNTFKLKPMNEKASESLLAKGNTLQQIYIKGFVSKWNYRTGLA